MIGSDELMSAIISMAIALLLTPWLAKLGVWGIRQWIEQDLAEGLRKVEPIWWAITSVLAVLMSVHHDFGLQFAAVHALFASVMLGLSAALLVQLARIDARCRLLPDPLTLGLIASGLIFHGFLMPDYLVHATIGAVIGYGLMWSLALAFQKLRGREAMGRGDFAMAAGIGAWLGWQGLPLALVLSCLLALVYAIFRNLLSSKSGLQGQAFLSQQLAFGPALSAGAAAAWITIG